MFKVFMNCFFTGFLFTQPPAPSRWIQQASKTQGKVPRGVAALGLSGKMRFPAGQKPLNVKGSDRFPEFGVPVKQKEKGRSKSAPTCVLDFDLCLRCLGYILE